MAWRSQTTLTRPFFIETTSSTGQRTWEEPLTTSRPVKTRRSKKHSTGSTATWGPQNKFEFVYRGAVQNWLFATTRHMAPEKTTFKLQNFLGGTTCVCAAAERAGDCGETATVLRIANL